MENTTQLSAQANDRYLGNLIESTKNEDAAYTYYLQQSQMNSKPGAGYYPNYPTFPHQISISEARHNSPNIIYDTSLLMENPHGLMYNTIPVPVRRRSGVEGLSKRRSGQAEKRKQTAPSAKRQKVANNPFNSKPQEILSSLRNEWDVFAPFNNHGTHVVPPTSMDDGSCVSECCSSCSEGLPCDEPDCDEQREAVIPCTKRSCNVPVCPESCLPGGEDGPNLNMQQGCIPSSERITSWNINSWNSQASRMPAPVMLRERIDPTLVAAAESVLSGSGSQSPSTPSIALNMETPYSTAQSLSTPQFSGASAQSPYENGSAPTISGPGTMFDTSGWAGFDDSTFGNGTFNCAWAECQLPFSTPEEWSSHLHQVHVDPQMTFDCPLQSDTCPSNLTSHPLDHLQAAHGFDFTYNKYVCPAPTCLENEIFCNPAMLHNHFDQAHATPATGSLSCQWNACNSTFTDQSALFHHLTTDHQLIDPSKERSVQEDVIPEEELSETESNSACQWDGGSGRCTVICDNPKELQEHINEHHLKDLNKSTGYFCQWSNCNRKKMGDKAGFSQRGKLVRHMQTHTILKEEVCDFPGCGKQFSAKQALLQHKRLHTGEKPFKCAHCNRAFAQQSACTMHERTHTGLKPLQCEHCGKRFSESSNLSKHRRMHEEEMHKKSYKCEVAGCGKAFVRLASLKNHKKEVHSGLCRAKEDSPGGSDIES